MSGKPQEHGGDQDDLLEKIISDGLNRIDNPGQEQKPAPQEEPSPPPAEEEQKPPEKNKRSSVYIYLLILFGAAFMMLLLAYFVQQRNSETAISDLRNSMNLSRTELMEQIEKLTEEKESLENKLELREYAVTQARENYEKEQLENQALNQELFHALMKLSRTTTLECLERFCREQDYLMAAVVVEDRDHYFNEKNSFYGEEYELLPHQNARYLELREEVFDRAGCMVLVEAEDSGGESSEQPQIDIPNADYSSETVTAARILWNIISAYLDQEFELAAYQASTLSADVNGLFELLYDGPFQPSTTALYEQIVADLEERGYVELNEDYSVAKVTLTDNADDIDIGAGVDIPGTPSDDVSRETSALPTDLD